MNEHIYAPVPRRSLKRKPIDLDESTPSTKRLQTERPVLDWLSHVQPRHSDHSALPRSQSAPAAFDTTTPVGDLEIVLNMSQQVGDSQTPVRPPTPASSLVPSAISISTQTNDSNYPQVLYGNGVIMDRSGRRIPSDIREFVANMIEKQRASPPLEQAELDKVVDLAEAVADSSEGAVHRLLDTVMFPIVQDGVGAGGDVPFSTEPLPRNSDTYFKLATPKPDRFCGYTTAQHGDFTRAQNNVMSHPHMTRYAQPTSDSVFPFLIIEVKSEAKGGTIWHAENQAAGSGSHCVNSMRWLLQHAKAETAGHPTPSEMEIESTETIAFSICLTARQVVLYVHSYSAAEQEHLMSYISSFLPTRAADIQECRNQIKNIMDFALDVRKRNVKLSLDELYPIPTTWPQKRVKHRARSSATSTPATSFSAPRMSKDE